MTKRHYKADIIFWIVFVSLGFFTGISLLKKTAREGFGSLSYGSVPYFDFLDRQDKSVTLHMLKGKVWLVNFVADRDEREYPQVLEVMNILHDKFEGRKNFRVITISMNEQKLDEISKNKKYTRWHFLGGNREEILNLMEQNFHIDNQKDTFSSSLKLFLIDQHALIRGYYTISGTDDALRIEKDLIRLL